MEKDTFSLTFVDINYLVNSLM